MYEPAIILVTTPEFTDRLERLLVEGRREEVLLVLFRDLLQMLEDHLALLTCDPSWPGRVEAAHTLVRECRAEEACRFDPARCASNSTPYGRSTRRCDAHGPTASTRCGWPPAACARDIERLPHGHPPRRYP